MIWILDKGANTREGGRRKVVGRLNGRRCERRPLNLLKAIVRSQRPIHEHTSLGIFLKPALKFGFFILKLLFTSKTPDLPPEWWR